MAADTYRKFSEVWTCGLYDRANKRPKYRHTLLSTLHSSLAQCNYR